MQQRLRITSLMVEIQHEDGTTEEVDIRALADFDLGYFKPLASNSGKQRFWIASDRDDLTAGNHVIASGITGGEVDLEIDKNRTNTMIGLIKDNACTAYVIYHLKETVPTTAEMKI